ncbi:MAG TPA: DUF4340 domain-containing protein [Xanthomonadales bacterium]|nr:DUF4340 domain-containing protein [Xanthomonadales bacterium]
MSKKHVSWLLVATLAVATVLLLMPGKTGKESVFEVTPLVPGLDQRVNDIARVRIVRAGQQPVASMTRADRGWVVDEAHSYPADWARLKELLAAVAQAKVVEQKTSNPDYFDRLGVTDIAAGDSSAVLVEIGEGEEMLKLLVGNAAQGRERQYVRFADGNQVLLIDRLISVSGEAADWLERDIIDLAEAEVVELSLAHADGEKVSISKVSAEDTDFTLADIPKGRKVASSFGVNALGGSLAGLRLEAVKPDTELDWSQSTRLRALTADGLEIQAEFISAEESGWLRLKAFAYAADEGESAQQYGETEAPTAAEREKRVKNINLRVSGWAYSIPEYQWKLMTKRKEDLLAPAGQG